MVGNSESRFVVGEDAAQAAKIAAVRDRLPDARGGDRDRAGDATDAIRSTTLRERGRGRDHAEVAARVAAVKPEDPYTIIYTSGTTGPPKGCVLTHGNYRQVTRMCEEIGDHRRGRRRLPVPAARALVRAADRAAGDRPRRARSPTGAAIRSRSCRELMAVKPHYLPSVPRIFEKIYTLVTSSNDPEKIARRHAARAEGPRRSRRPASRSRRAAGGLRQGRRGAVRRTSATCSAAACVRRPPARRRSRSEILEFFYACGVPVLEGYGMTETVTASTVSTGRRLQVRHRRAPAAPAPRSGSPRTARSSSRVRTSSTATTRWRTSRSARSRTAGCTPATSARSTRTATSRSPAARRTSSSPPAARTSRRRTSRTTSSSRAGSRRR